MTKQLKIETIKDILNVLAETKNNQLMQPVNYNGKQIIIYVNLQQED